MAAVTSRIHLHYVRDRPTKLQIERVTILSRIFADDQIQFHCT